MERDQALDLLRSQHEFPGPFEFRIVVRPHVIAPTVTAVVAAAGDGASLLNVDERPSRSGNFRALHVRMTMPAAESVLDVYDGVRSLDGVLAAM